MKELSVLGSIGGVLGWDERVILRPGGMEFRATQSAFLAKMHHERFTSPRIGEWLGALEASELARDPYSDGGTIIREVRRDYDRATKLPTSLVEELSRTTVMAQTAWEKARAENDFAGFSPWLAKMIDLKKQEAACISGGKGNAYDALLDTFEPGETAASIAKVFASFKDQLIELIGKIQGSSRKIPFEILERSYPAAIQEQFAKEAAAKVGFDFNAGRLDVSVHPFCSGVAPGDTRLTTRYDEKYFGDAFFGTLHETGHGLYEQGLPKSTWNGLPLAQAVSLGIHESQSRLWENLVGRSRPFWVGFFPRARELFGATLNGVSLEEWMSAINHVQPSLIRVEADEATYNLHILLRFELEQEIFNGDVKVDDIPALWNERVKKYLGITPPDHARGCLQDVHWSCGLYGYFPTYTLGNLYAAQFFEQIRIDLPDIDQQIARGEFVPLLGWLRTNIHQHGQRYRGAELVQRITGKPLSADALLRHLSSKAKEYYGV